MDDVFVGSLMSSPVYTVSNDTSLQNAGETMREHEIGSIIVVGDDDHLEGIITATDFIHVVAEGDPDPNATVASVMSTEVITTTASESVQTAANIMIEHGFDHLPVIDGEAVIGVITTTDLTAYLSTTEEPSPS